ncbi:mucin-5AC-like [Haliotis rufescens]|uniref:mucin-5AC-like n=1 Tax=Haliotis rufescens TaxID=6454 RepID=UPI00201EC2E6|nr:mucin-5AC-like [Haliotis rufescens]
MESCSPGNGSSGMGTLLVLQPKSLRGFTTSDDYLFAMKEDLAEWFQALYKIDINAENFFEELETGVLLCRHANEVVQHYRLSREHGGVVQMKSYFVRDVPEAGVQYRNNVKPGTFMSRDNISNFLTWCVHLGIPDVVRFETEDLVMRKNEKSVVLCLLEVARVGAKLGMLAPTLVQMEEEIDEEIATGEPPPQIITCDLKSLDELVRELVGRCSCPIQFQLIKVGEGKYKIGDSQTLIFVRVLRNHVMVRVGGGWDTLEHYLDKHDPCRCNFQGHHRPGPSQRLIQARRGSTPSRTTPPRTTTPTPGGTSTMKSPRKMSVPGPVSSKTSSISVIRSKSPGPVSRKLPTPQQLSCQSNQHASQLGRKSPLPSRLRSPSPVSHGGRKLPTPKTSQGPPTPSRRSASPGPRQRDTTLSDSRSSGLSKTAPCTPRKMSMEALDVDDDGNAASSGDIDMNQINTMTLEEFRNLLNKQLSVPQVGAASQNGSASQSSDSPRSQGSSDSSRAHSLSSRTASATSSWRAVREKARTVCQSLESSAGTRVSRTSSSNDSGYLSQNGDTPKRSLPNRPKTPTSVSRPKTPVSRPSGLISESRPKTPTSSVRPKTPTNSYQRSKTPTRNYQRPKTPTHSAATTPSSVDEYKVIGQSGSRPSTPVLSERPSTPTCIPRPSGIPRPSTPSSQVVANDNDKPAGPQKGERRLITRPTTPGTPRKQLPPRPASTVPQEKSYTSIFQARRSSTPGPGQGQTRTATAARERRSVVSRTSAVSRSSNYPLSKRSQSVADVRTSFSRTSTEISLSDEESESVTSDERSRPKSRTVSAAEMRQRTSSAEPRRLVRQAASEESCLMVARTDDGAHCITLTSNGNTKYDSSRRTNRFIRSASSENCDSPRSRQRARTPDPSMIRQEMTRRKSEISIGSGKSTESRTEAWVNSTVHDTKRKLPPRPKRAMTPNSMNRKELELTSRSFAEIKEALRVPMENGIVVNPDKLDAPPEDAKAYLQMEKLFKKLKEKELRESVNNTVGGANDDDSVNNRDNTVSQGILKNPDAKAASNRSLNSVRFSNSSLSSLSSGNSKCVSSHSTPVHRNNNLDSPLNHSRSLPSFASSSHNLTSTPLNGVSSSGMEDENDSGDEDTFGNTAEALVYKLKEMAKLRPRKEDTDGPKSRIPAPNLSKNRKSKSFSNLSTSLSFDKETQHRNLSETSNEEPVFYNPDDDDELSEMARIAHDREELQDRSETPVPRMATPLTTGRSTFLNNGKDKTPRLVRAVSQDRSPSNSVSSLSSLSLSNADNDPEFV